MNPEIKKLIVELEAQGTLVATEAAMVLRSVFDPENQPSQYGTTLISSSSDS